MHSIDLNCDMGEGMENDALLMPLITSANIACGFHAGDATTMQATVQLAEMHHVAVGAHPGFPDKTNFGRIEMNFSPGEIYNLIYDQVKTLQEVCSSHNTVLHHVKPHGALYNMAARQPDIAHAIAWAVFDLDKHLRLYGLAGSHLVKESVQVGLKTVSEVFADRTYAADGTLTLRKQPDALITDKQQVLQQVLQMVQQGRVTTTSGSTIPVIAQTICLHGDGPHAVAFAGYLRQQLVNHGIEIKQP